MNIIRIRSRLMRLIILVFILSSAVLPQSLSVKWEKVNNFYETEVYDSVITNMPELLRDFENAKLDSQLVTACHYLEMSLFRAGQDRSADSIRQTAELFAQKHSLLALMADYIQERNWILLDIASGLQKRDSRTKQVTNSGRVLAILHRIIITPDDSLSLTPKLRAYALSGQILKTANQTAGITDALKPALKLVHADDTVNVNEIKAILRFLSESYLTRGDIEEVYLLMNDFGYRPSYRDIITYSAKFLNSPKGNEFDRLFTSLRDNYLFSPYDSIAFDYVISRFVMESRLYNINAAIDSLQSTIVYLETSRDTTGTLLFNVYQMYIKKCLENFMVAQSAWAFNILERRYTSSTISGDLRSALVSLKGDILAIRGEYMEAEKLYLKQLPSLNLLKPIERLSLLNNLGLCQTALGKVPEGSETFGLLKTQVSLISDTSARIKEFLILANLNEGILFLRNDKPDSAITQFKEGQRIAKEMNFSSYTALFYIRLADAFRSKGYTRQASEMFDSLRATLNILTEPFKKMQIYESLAAFESEKGNTEQSLDYYSEALLLAERNAFSGAKINLAGSIADVYLQCDSLRKALGLFRVVREAVERNGSKVDRYYQNLKMALVFLNTNEFDSSRTYIGNCFNLLTDRSNPNIDSLASLKVQYPYLLTLTISLLAEVNFYEGQTYADFRKIKLAYSQAQRAVEYNKANFADVFTYQGESTQFLKSVDCYKVLIEIALHLYEKTNDDEYMKGAFDACENSRSQAFVSEIGSKVFFNIPETQVDTAEVVQHISKTMKRKKNQVMANAGEINPYSRRRDIDVVQDTTRDVLKEQQQYNEYINSLKKTNTKTAGLLSPDVNVLSIKGIATSLAEDEVLLNYYVSRNRTYLFYITNSDSRVISIPLDEKTIAEMCETYRMVLQNKGDTSDMSRGFKTLGQSENKKKIEQNIGLSWQLYNYLIAPVEKDIVNKKLLIVPSGALHAIPFSSLMNKQKKYLIETNSVSVLPNASAIQLILKNIKSESSRNVLAFGNPDCGDIASPLPGAEAEVNMIASYFPKSSVFIGADAQERKVKDLISNYSIIHFACHGVFNGDYPLLSRLLLTAGNNEDGNLELRELYNLKLSKCNLVVLSACESGLAKVKKNDDLIGLVRGFLYAGSPGVIASLWKVDDAATSFLMERLYFYLSNNFSRGEALQKAQMDTMQSPLFSHPYFWSAFQLNGVGR